MALDLSKIKGISDEVKERLAKAKTGGELKAAIEAEQLSKEQLKELAGGSDCPFDGMFCFTDGLCFGESCQNLPI